MRFKKFITGGFAVCLAMTMLLMGASFSKVEAKEDTSASYSAGDVVISSEDSAAYIWDDVNKTKIKLGDVENDTKVDVRDLVRIRKYVEDSTIEIQERASDINFDGYVNQSDVNLLRKQLAGADQYWSDVY